MSKRIIMPALVALSLVTGESAAAPKLPDSQAAVAVQQLTLSDIQGHWANDAIQAAISKGIVDGYPDGTFKPDQGISRAEFITLLSKALNKKTDASGDWFAPYVAGLQKDNIVYAGQFDDYNAPMTRLELATVALRAVKEEFRVPEGAENADSSKIMYNAVGLGLIQGMSGGALEPGGQTTRAQSTTIIERVLKLQQGEVLPTDAAAKELSELAATGTNLRSTKNVTPARRMPITYDIPYGTMTIKEIIFIDTDKDSPFKWMLDGAKRSGYYGLSDNFEHSYVFAYKLKFDITSPAQVAIRILDIFDMLGWDSVARSGIVGAVDNGKVYTFETYRIFVIDKAKADKASAFIPYYQVGNESYPTVAESYDK
ncbi:S-layer homology domain-containing protein [Paenibacillus rigui]|nr:S-layer homology domain-containing protein [Paenibacillus rigui]